MLNSLGGFFYGVKINKFGRIFFNKKRGKRIEEKTGQSKQKVTTNLR
jgi:hypothetical protein